VDEKMKRTTLTFLGVIPWVPVPAGGVFSAA
jgi:hypothetical protein